MASYALPAGGTLLVPSIIPNSELNPTFESSSPTSRFEVLVAFDEVALHQTRPESAQTHSESLVVHLGARVLATFKTWVRYQWITS
ncbi:hypothetical protein [Rhodopirellula sp. MGV]|uniref:hypothetical protein n=1 Tax=Rhodopirellula sp. MGV TaxID=2023130 RepID=UPI000B9766E6|nr:hypothetical protein [Rhodopirellula sp. MGV]OYP38281.1 hypothetical protein CGZ80_03445 [Rhodopirellula sp. MGV]PNY38618.1 hypothetical protein C2E31_01495 [Rhodopirellula baltica]